MCNVCMYCVGDIWFYWRKVIISILQIHEGVRVNLVLEHGGIFCRFFYSVTFWHNSEIKAT